MEDLKRQGNSAKFWSVVLLLMFIIGLIVAIVPYDVTADPSTTATYSRGVLHLSIPYEAAHAGSGKLTIEVLDPDDNILGRVEKDANVTAGDGRWREEIQLEKPMGRMSAIACPVQLEVRAK